jgi:hypothetical protein
MLISTTDEWKWIIESGLLAVGKLRLSKSELDVEDINYREQGRYGLINYAFTKPLAWPIGGSKCLIILVGNPACFINLPSPVGNRCCCTPH